MLNNHSNSLEDVMIDLETLGTAPGSAILSIGAVMFGPTGLGETFYAPVPLQSCFDAGLTVEAGTIAWWMRQSDEARAAAFPALSASSLVNATLREILIALDEWLTTQKAKRPWSHGATFDMPILDAAYRACKLVSPWEFWNVRDTRTLYDLAGVKVDRSKGTHHNALDDARAQAEAAVKALNILKPADERLVWAALAENGSVIVWAHQRNQVELVAAKYGRPVVPVVVLSPTSIQQPAGVLQVANAAALDVLAERHRQVNAEGYDHEHDDYHVLGEIAAYAAYYAMPPGAREWPATETGYADTFGEALVPDGWNPTPPGDRRGELVKAGALVLAEIDRMDRAAAEKNREFSR